MNNPTPLLLIYLCLAMPVAAQYSRSESKGATRPPEISTDEISRGALRRQLREANEKIKRLERKLDIERTNSEAYKMKGDATKYFLKGAQEGEQKNGELAQTRWFSNAVLIGNTYPGAGWLYADRKIEAGVYLTIFSAVFGNWISASLALNQIQNERARFRQTAFLASYFSDTNTRTLLAARSWQLESREKAARERFNDGQNWTLRVWFTSFLHSAAWSIGNSRPLEQPTGLQAAITFRF